MGKDHRGKPSGVDKSEERTGIPTVITPENMPVDNEMTEKYTRDDQDIAENIHTRHPNRNTDKEGGPDSGGYRS